MCYAQEQLSGHDFPVKMAAQIVARAWHDALFRAPASAHQTAEQQLAIGVG